LRGTTTAKTVVLKLVEELGFDGVDAGGLDESWRQQPGTPVYTKDFDADGRPLITVWLEMRTDVSRSLTNSPQFSGISAGSNAACAVSAAS
jgi:hypothetical protein